MSASEFDAYLRLVGFDGRRRAEKILEITGHFDGVPIGDGEPMFRLANIPAEYLEQENSHRQEIGSTHPRQLVICDEPFVLHIGATDPDSRCE